MLLSLTQKVKRCLLSVFLGANDMYDIIKFRVGITVKKVPALQVAALAPAVGAEVYLLPYSTQKGGNVTRGKVKKVDNIGGDKYHYYTLDMVLKDKMVSCPVTTADGKVFEWHRNPRDKILPLSAMRPVRLSPCLKISVHLR